jgi:hypothetical protein
MTFIARQLAVQLDLSPSGGTFDSSGNNLLQLNNLRMRVTIQSTQGGATPFQSQMQLTLWGMTNNDMSALSTLGLTSGQYRMNSISVTAGDNVTGMTTVFNGAIYFADVDYNQQPNVPVKIYASATTGLRLPPVAATSRAGSVSVAALLQAVCTQAGGLRLVNNGVTATLANHCVGGSALAQIADICLASLTNWRMSPDGTMLYIWPMGGTTDNTPPIGVSAQNGMVGYPMYSAQGIDIVTEFNPNIQVGRQVSVQSSIPTPGPNAPVVLQGAQPIGATGTFYVFDVVHDLASQLPKGPWFTRTKMGTTNTQVRA